MGGPGGPGGTAGRKLNAGITQHTRDPGASGGHGGTGDHRAQGHRIIARVGNDERIGSCSHIVVVGLETPIIGVPRVGSDHRKGRISAPVVADLDGRDGEKTIQELDGSVIGVAPAFEFVGDVPRGVVVGQKGHGALGVVPGNVNLPDGRSG